MSVQSLLLGYIKEAWPGVAAGGDPVRLQGSVDAAARVSHHNEAVLEALPARDAWPPLGRPMFAWPPSDDPTIAFRARLIHFAACQNALDQDLGDWLEKFEGLLRRLYWEAAYVRVETAYIGTQEFCWRPTGEWVSDLCKGVLRPIDAWSFERTISKEELAPLRNPVG
jgi:hypothetical protein